MRVLPRAAAVACAAAAGAFLLDRQRYLGLAVLGLSLLAAAVLAVLSRRVRHPSDRDVAGVDRAAALDGSLHSAHWFARHPAPPAGRHGDEEWIAFHVETAAARAAAVDWRAVYAEPFPARRGLAAVGLVLATAALSIAPSPRIAMPEWLAGQDADALIVVPSHLAGEVVEGMNALKAGQTPSREALTAVGRALEIARTDPRARRELDDLFAKAAAADPRWLDGAWNHDWDVNERPDWDEGMPALEWAYETAAARAALDDAARADEGTTEADTNGRDRQPGERGTELSRGSTSSKRPDSAILRPDARGETGTFTSFLFGRQQAQSDGGVAAGAPAAGQAASIAAALRREVVHARTDVGEPPRAPLARRPSGLGPSAVDPGVPPTGLRYDASHAARPPVVPEARRALVHDFFLRAADTGVEPRAAADRSPEGARR